MDNNKKAGASGRLRHHNVCMEGTNDIKVRRSTLESILEGNILQSF